MTESRIYLSGIGDGGLTGNFGGVMEMFYILIMVEFPCQIHQIYITSNEVILCELYIHRVDFV